MTRILILLASLLVVGCQVVWADSRLESQFPRMAHLFGESRTQAATKLEKELVAEIELKDGRLIFSVWNRYKGQRSAAICDAQGELASNVRSLSKIRTTEFEFSCGGEERKTFKGNWALRLLKGTIDRIELRTVEGEGNWGQGLLVFLSPEDYAEYLKDREERRPKLFGTDEWLEQQDQDQASQDNQIATIPETTKAVHSPEIQSPESSVQQFFSETRTTKSQYQKCYAWFNAEKFSYDGFFFRNWGEVIRDAESGHSAGQRLVVAVELVYLCNAFLGPYRLSWTAPLPNELQEQSSQENQVAAIPDSTKTIDPPKTQLPEVVDSQPTEADKNIELEFWQSIKDSNDSDMYREYLRQFPSGVYAGLAKLKIKRLGGDPQVVNASIPNLDYGDYYALVIGNNDYQDLTNLRSAVNDAKVVSTVLEVDYGFNVQLLENASRKEILQSLKHLRQSVSAKDNVLIYYAGHGYLDEAADEAGTITRAIKIEQRTPEWLSQIVKKKARTALTSGGLEPVLDTGSGNHSAFAYAFISLLEENDGVLDGAQLFTKLRPKVMVNSTQTPQYGKIHMAGDDGGDFLFVRQ